MRLLIATPLYPPEPGGPATYAKLLFEGLPSRGIEVEVVKFSDVRHLPKLIRHIAYYQNVKRAAKNADAILALDPVSVGLPAMKAAKKLRKPFFVKIVGDYAWEQGAQRFGVTSNLDEFVKEKSIPFPVRLLRSVQMRVATAATAVLVPSVYLKGIVGAWGVPEERIKVIYNSVALTKGGSVEKAIRELPRPHLVTAGRLVPWKHMDTVIDAAAKVGGSLIIVGDGPERAYLEARAQRVLPSTTFTGALSHADTLALIEEAEVFILNSSYEGLSHLLIEALSLGTPSVATAVGGNPEVLSGSAGGVLVPFGDADALHAGISQACTMKRNADPSFAARFAASSMLDATAEFFKTTV